MDEENKLSWGNCAISIIDKDVIVSAPKLPILEHTTSLDHATVRDTVLPTPIATGAYSFNFNSEHGKEYLELLEKEWLGTTTDNADALREVTIVIEGKPYINRPNNLKYPNKKRAKRIWNKWRNRFGVTPTRGTVIPKATLSVMSALRNNQQYYGVKAVVEKGDLI